MAKELLLFSLNIFKNPFVFYSEVRMNAQLDGVKCMGLCISAGAIYVMCERNGFLNPNI
jgi:hypothetical protein